MTRAIGDVLEIAPEPKDGWVICPNCGEKWMALDGEVCARCRERHEAEHLRRESSSREQVLERARVPKRIRSTKFQDPHRWPTPQNEKGDALERWTGDPELVTLQGVTNTGKSTLAAELVYRSGLEGYWLVAADVPSIAIQERNRFERILEFEGVLVVDELGRGHNRDAWEYLLRLVGGRWDEMLPTVVTSNLPLAELTAAHPALARRIGEAWWVPLGKSWGER